MSHAAYSLYVVNAKTGDVVFEKNAQLGLAPASTQKIITSTTAFMLLGNSYQYKTYIRYDIGIKNGELLGNLYVDGAGDPTLGSIRWTSTRDTAVMHTILSALKRNGIRKIRGDIWINDVCFELNPVPGGWTWQDIGNYYGAGTWGLNWQENQYDLVLKSPIDPGGLTTIVKTDPYLYGVTIHNLIKSGEKGSGDNGYIYMTPYNTIGFATGTIRPGENAFRISGSLPRPAMQFGQVIAKTLHDGKIIFSNKIKLTSDSVLDSKPGRRSMLNLDSILSPTLDSMNYWFLRKSINLYGETFLKTLAKEKYFIGTSEKGIDIIQDFWQKQGVDKRELNMKDGSGLSPENRITTHAQVTVLKFARQQTWFPSFYSALPEFNNMKMKSGTIADCKAFCGYQQSNDGNEYIFSFIVNNYSGGSISAKMYKVLDALK